MTGVLCWLSPDVVEAVGWTLVHFVWQGAVIALVLYALTAFCRSALTRYNAAVAALVLMIASPIATFLFLRENSAPGVQPYPVKDTFEAIQALGNSPVAIPVSAIHSMTSIDWLSWFVWAWFAGVLIFGIRALGGWIVLERLRRESAGQIAASLLERCLDLQQRLGLSRPVRYLESRIMDAPAVLGWFRPVVLLPVTALTGLSPDQLDAVIAHELAHIKRFDCFVNFFQIAVETVLFYHPAIWWVSRRVRTERENCCDDVAVSVCGNVGEYARALTLMESWRSAPAALVAANSGSLRIRIGRLLGLRTITRSVPRSGLAAIGVLCAAGAVLASTTFNVTLSHFSDSGMLPPQANEQGGATVELAQLERPSLELRSGGRSVIAFATRSTYASASRAVICPNRATSAETSPAMASTVAFAGDPVGQELPAPAALPSPSPVPATAAVPGPASTPAPAPPSFPASTPAPALAPEQASTPEPAEKGSYIDGLRAAGITNLSVDDLISLKVQGVTPEYIRDMRAAGLNPSVHDLIAMKAQGITAEYVRDIRATGLNPSVHDLIGMKAMGVSPEYVRKVRSGGWTDATVHDLIAMKAQGVAETDAVQYRQLGLKDLTLHQLISLKAMGVTPDYIRAMQSAGFSNLSAREYISAKAQGVTPEFVQKVRGHGFKDLSMRQLIGLKAAGVF